ncbi:41735_t:CDS:2, partial [Gigaspora margarita]
DYVESLNDGYLDVESVNSENSEVSNSDFTDFSFLLSQQHFLVHSETLRVVFSDNSLIDLDFQTVVEAYGYNSSHEDFSLKTFLEQEIIFLDLSS